MKKIILVFLVLVSISCTSEEEKNDVLVKEIIENSYYGIDLSTKIKDIEKIKEDIFSLPLSGLVINQIYPSLKKYINIDENRKIDDNTQYVLTRHLYKKNDGVYLMFYIIDLTKKQIIKTSNDYDAFFRPILIEIIKREPDDYYDSYIKGTSF